MSLFFIQRILPLLLIGGGLSAGTGAGQRALDRIVDTVKTVACTMELGGIADAMKMESFMYGDRMKNDPRALAKFIRDNLKSKNAKRDTSKDLWGKPYLMKRATDMEGEKIVVLMSLGPNGKMDACDNAGHIQVMDRMRKDMAVVQEIGRRQQEKGEKLHSFFDDPDAMDDPDKIGELASSLRDGPDIEDPYKIPKDDDICVQVQLARTGVYKRIR